MRYRVILTFALMLSLALLFGAADAESREITEACRYTASVNKQYAARVATDDYSRAWDGAGGQLTVILPEGEHACGIQLSFYRVAVPVIVEAVDAAGKVTNQARYEERFLNAYIPLRSDRAYRVGAAEPKAELRLNRVRVFAGNEKSVDAQTWHVPESPVDLLQIVTHPDDDLIWFGGLLPLYAGERGMNVLVAYAATQGSLKACRFNELLDGLWACGVTAYPELGPFADFQVKSVQAVINRWGEGAAQRWCTGLIRRYRPKVVVTQDLRGESGHMQHQLLAQAVVDAVTEWSGDAKHDPESAAAYGVFTPQKLYIHRYRQNEIFMDWDQPLRAFGGKTGTEVARRAFKMHVSQRNTHYTIYTHGPMDSRYLGLYFTTVGEDIKKNDLFEHVQ